ncbi:unnamed protein product [Phytophthora fragariaefolia]|uniref:Unnamed protein product n=1 Tax=Phytophthora fragariaefolia TaxID=1490495 RepID=A0A9W6X7J6_9STRA|nr:unnamed protein product [Phytophthora fragariaefolia]
MTPSDPSNRGEGLSAESPPRSRVSPRVSSERECSFVDQITSSEADSGSRQASRMSPPRQPSPPGDTTSDTEDKSNSARRVTLESLEYLMHFQASQREQELAELARLVAFSLTRPAVPSDRAQRDAVLSAASIHELGDALRNRFAGPDSSAVIADMRSELQEAQQINLALTRRLDTQSAELADLRSQLNIMTLERDRLLDLSKHSTAFTASLRKSAAELEAQAAVARSQADAQVAAVFRHADGFKRQVEARDQGIAALRVSIADRDRAYADLQGVASKDFAQLQESVRSLTVPPGSSSPRQASGRTAQPSPIGLAASEVDSVGGPSQLRQMPAQLRRVRLNTLTPAEKLRRLSHPVSATAAGSRRKPHQPPDQPYSITLPGEEGHEEVMELLAGDDLGTVSDGELLRLSAASSRRRRHRRPASSSVTPSSAARVARPASAAGEASFDFDLGDPMEDVELDASVQVGVSATSSTGAVSTTGTSSVVAATLSVSDRVALGLESSSDSTSRGAGSSAKPLELLSGSSDAESDSTGRVATHGKAQSYLALGRTPPPSPRSSDSARGMSAPRSSSFPKKTRERRKHKRRHKHKHQNKHRHKHKRRLSDLEDSAGSAGDADHPRRSKRLASSDSAVRPRPSKKSRRDLPPSTSRLSNLSAGASPVVPSSLPSTTAFVGVTPHPGVHSTPALPAVLRVAFSTFQTRAAQAASRDSRITPQNARLHDLPFLHFGSARFWKAILERQTGQIVRAGGDRSWIPPTPSSLDGLRAFADVSNLIVPRSY